MMQVDGDDRSVTSPEWRRVSLIRTFLVLLVPVAALALTSYLLWRAIAQSTPETFEDIHFWFYFFDVGREINVPTWFSAGLWILIGVLTGYYARRAARFRVSWGFFSFVAVFLSLDETLELHERLDVIGNQMAPYLPVQLGFTWVIPGVLIAAILCALLLRLVLSLPRSVMLGLIASGVVFVGGSVGAESLSGMALVNGGAAPSFFVLTLIEETLEMTGLALCLASLLHALEHRPVDGGIAYRVAAIRRVSHAPRASEERTIAHEEAAGSGRTEGRIHEGRAAGEPAVPASATAAPSTTARSTTAPDARLRDTGADV